MTTKRTFDLSSFKGASVAVVGCGTHALGKGYGAKINAHDIVIRANSSFMVDGLELDYGTRTDVLMIGNPAKIFPILPKWRNFLTCPVGSWWKSNIGHIAAADANGGFDIVMPDNDTATAWPYSKQPLAGTYGAVMAAFYGASSLLLVGLDLYKDKYARQGIGIFPGHYNGYCDTHLNCHDRANDNEALLKLTETLKVEWLCPK